MAKVEFYKVISQSSTVTRLLVISIDEEQLGEIIHLLQPLGKVKSVLPFCPTVTGKLPNSYADLNVDQNNNLIIKTLQPRIAALGLTENLNIHQAAAFAAAAKDYK